jgi:hypothetical protein
LSITTPQQPVILKGQLDYNDNGYVDSADSIVLQGIVAEDKACPSGKFCDFSNDGSSVTAADLVKFMIYVGYPAKIGTLDYTNDGVVDAQDAAFLTYVWNGTMSCPSGRVCDVDGNSKLEGHDIVDLNDKIIKYDLNKDGKLSYLDSNKLNSVVAGVACPSGKLCDIDGNGVAATNDVTILTTYVGTKAVIGQIDYNNNGVVDNADRLILDAKFAGDKVCPTGKFCDFNNDGASISSADVTKYALYVTGQ